MNNEYPEFDIIRIIDKFGISFNNLESIPLKVDELEKIYNNYVSRMPQLEELKKEILSLLNEVIGGRAHSVRGRIKDPDHLIEKIIRNCIEKPDKYAKVSCDDYYKLITDLIGFRIIIIDKREWRNVHYELLDTFHNDPNKYLKDNAYDSVIEHYNQYSPEDKSTEKRMSSSFHSERPQVYITSEDDRDLYADDFLKVDSSKRHYRSLHYIVRYGKYYFEIQVRTIFEEGWLEFDHKITYPYDKFNSKKKEYLKVLNNLASAADQLISLYNKEDFENDDIPAQINAEEQSTEKNSVTGDQKKSIESMEDYMRKIY